jgi:hypothetical protein
MTNLLQQAINCDDGYRAARIIQEALGIESDGATTASPKLGRPTTSNVPVLSALGYKPRRDIWPRDRTPPLPAALVGR